MSTRTECGAGSFNERTRHGCYDPSDEPVAGTPSRGLRGTHGFGGGESAGPPGRPVRRGPRAAPAALGGGAGRGRRQRARARGRHADDARRRHRRQPRVSLGHQAAVSRPARPRAALRRSRARRHARRGAGGARACGAAVRARGHRPLPRPRGVTRGKRRAPVGGPAAAVGGARRRDAVGVRFDGDAGGRLCLRGSPSAPPGARAARPAAHASGARTLATGKVFWSGYFERA